MTGFLLFSLLPMGVMRFSADPHAPWLKEPGVEDPVQIYEQPEKED